MLISSNAKNTFEWIQWVVSENQELAFVEKPLVRKHTMGNLKPISVETLKNQMTKIVQVIELDLAKTLPKKFGIAFDGWSELSIHYLAVFALGANVPNGKVLLGFSPFEDEADLAAEEGTTHAAQLLNQLHHQRVKSQEVLSHLEHLHRSEEHTSELQSRP